MGSESKTLIVFDTNSLIINQGKGLSYNSFEFNIIFDNVLNFLERNKLREKVSMAIPKISIEELKNRKLYWFKNEAHTLTNSFLPFSKISDTSLKIPRQDPEYTQLLNKLIEEYLGKMDFITLDYPHEKCFPNILKRALDKKKPFIVTKEHSDYGFKDVVIWESVLQYDKLKEFDKVILVTGDNTGFDEVCIKEFAEKVDKRIVIYKLENNILEELSKDYNLKIEYEGLNKFINSEYFEEILVKDIQNKDGINIEGNFYRITGFGFEPELAKIENQLDDNNEETGLYEVIIPATFNYKIGSKEKDIKFHIIVIIDDANEVQEIVYDEELV